jgi:hypothetical protein
MDDDILYSSDGVNWETQAVSGGFYTWKSLAYGNGKYVVISSNKAMSAYSSNLTDWTLTEMPETLDGIAFGNGIFISVSSPNNSYYTS